jgi:hypothetical protein
MGKRTFSSWAAGLYPRRLVFGGRAWRRGRRHIATNERSLTTTSGKAHKQNTKAWKRFHLDPPEFSKTPHNKHDVQ